MVSVVSRCERWVFRMSPELFGAEMWMWRNCAEYYWTLMIYEILVKYNTNIQHWKRYYIYDIIWHDGHNHLILTCVWWRIEVKRVVKFCTHAPRCEEVYESLWVSWSIVVQKTSDWNLRMMTCCLRGQKRSSFYSDCAWKVRRQSGTRTIKTSRNSL